MHCVEEQEYPEHAKLPAQSLSPQQSPPAFHAPEQQSPVPDSKHPEPQAVNPSAHWVMEQMYVTQA